MLKFIGRHWHGETNFWLGTLLFSIALPVCIYVAGIQWIGLYALQDTPTSRMIQAALVSSLIGAVGIWQLIGTWRASSKSKSPERWLLTRWGARVAAVATAGMALLILTKIPSGMASLYADATDADRFGQEGYSVVVEGDQIVVNGSFAWGLLDKTASLLAQNGQIQTAVVDGPGGHVGVGTRLGAMIKARNLDTLTTKLCASACTDAFVAGKNRYLRKGAKLGFHSVGGDSPLAIEIGKKRTIEHWRAAGLTEDFIARVFETPADSVWYPTYDELLGANVITAVVK